MSLCCFYYRVAVPWRAQLRTDRETAVNLVQYNTMLAATICLQTFPWRAQLRTERETAANLVQYNTMLAATVCLQTFPWLAQLRAGS